MSRGLFDRLSHFISNRKEAALITITVHPEKSLVGSKILLPADEEERPYHEESGLPAELLSHIMEQSKIIIEKRKTKTVQFDADGVAVECYVEFFQAPPHLIVAGAGHVSEPVAEIGKMLGFYVTIIDDRPEYANERRFPYADEAVCASYVDYFSHVAISPDTFIVLLTRGHKFDVVSLQQLLKREENIHQDKRTAYIGMIGSKRRISGVFEQLKDEFTDHNFMNIYSPVGLDIGANTPAEIAVSIMAEILKVKTHASGNSLKERIASYSQLKFRERVIK